MQLRSVAVTLVAVLLAVGAGTGGALAATDSLHAQQSPTNTTDAGTDTTTSGTGDTAAEAGSPSITFNDQNSSGESVFIQSATLPESGFVAIYDSSRSGNETNQVIGASYPLSAGTSDNIRIQLDESLNQTKSLTAVIHTDSNDNDAFDFVASNGQQDSPLMQGDRRIVDIATVSAQSSDTADGGTNTTAAESGGATDAGEATDAGGDGQTAADASGNDTGGENASGGGDSSSSGPGFGLAAAVVALLAAALLATRRN